MATYIKIQTEMSQQKTVQSYFKVEPRKVLMRIVTSFVPPGEHRRTLEADLIGPLIAVILLCSILQYGHSSKVPFVSNSPLELVLYFVVVIPLLSFLVLKAEKNSLSYLQVVSLCGYALYSHIVTLLIAFNFHKEGTNWIFYVCLLVFGGMSCARLVVIFTLASRKPVVRLLVCSVACTGNLLFLLFTHFVYMHPSFKTNHQI